MADFWDRRVPGKESPVPFIVSVDASSRLVGDSRRPRIFASVGSVTPVVSITALTAPFPFLLSLLPVSLHFSATPCLV